MSEDGSFMTPSFRTINIGSCLGDQVTQENKKNFVYNFIDKLHILSTYEIFTLTFKYLFSA